MFIAFVKNNITLVAVALFVLSFSLIMSFKPGFLFNKDGSIRNFGLGYKKKTVIPLWFITIIIVGCRPKVNTRTVSLRMSGFFTTRMVS